MTAQTLIARRSTFTIGWSALLLMSAMGTLSHLVLAFVMPDLAVSFLGWTAFNLYSTIILSIPFRRGEPWAWYTTWILVVGFAAPILFDQESFTVWYLGGAGVMAVCLLLTRSAFFQEEPHAA